MANDAVFVVRRGNPASWSQVRLPNSFVSLGTARSDPLILAFRHRGRDRGNRLEQHATACRNYRQLTGRCSSNSFCLATAETADFSIRNNRQGKPTYSYRGKQNF